jgi:hypothetical protein
MIPVEQEQPQTLQSGEQGGLDEDEKHKVMKTQADFSSQAAAGAAAPPEMELGGRIDGLRAFGGSHDLFFPPSNFNISGMIL